MTQVFQPPGSWEQNAVAPVYVDGVPLERLVDAVRLSQTSIDQRQSDDNRFWSSARRESADGTLEIFEIGLSTPKAINIISFEAAHFPHRIWPEWWDAKAKTWRAVREYLSEASTRNPATKVSQTWVNSSMPAVILPPNQLRPGEHPQHYGAGHWVAIDIRCASFTSSRVRLVLQRVRNFAFPRNVDGQAAPYALGIRGFLLGFRADALTDVPRTGRSGSVVTERDSFAATTDLLGSSLEFTVRENRATDLLNGYVWRSEPQPVNYAVVNCYVDARDPQGRPQVVDRFDIDPLYSGVHVNLYWSDDVPAQDAFEASDALLTFPAARGNGVALGQSSAGLLFPMPVGYVEVDNSRVQWDLGLPCWLGMIFQPQYEMSDATTYWVLDSETVSVWVKQGVLHARVGTSTLSLPLSFVFNDQIAFALSGDPRGISLQAAGMITSVPLTSAVASPSVFRLGASLVPEGVTPAPGNYRLRSLVIKQEMIPDGELDLYVSDPTAYVTKSTYTSDDTGTTSNALLRYDPSFQTVGESSTNPYGLVGGPGVSYEGLVWHPINRDFTANKGTMTFDPVKTRFFKFEFTNLAPQPYASIAQSTRTVRIFSPEVVAQAVPRATTVSTNTGGAGTTVNKDLAPQISFLDSIRLPAATATPYSNFTPTEALHSSDPSVAASLSRASNLLNFQRWQTSSWVPRFSTVGTHLYQTVQVQVNNKVGFFAGLRGLRMYRVSYLADDDTDQYIELLHDDLNIDQEGAIAESGLTWSFEPGHLRTPGYTELDVAVTQSQVFRSYRRVRGVQFATQQSPPMQLMVDPDFTDQTLSRWDPVGDTTITISDDYTSDIGSTVQVTRGVSENVWGNLELRYASWDDIEASDPSAYAPTWDDLEGQDGDVQLVGGIRSTQLLSGSLSGRMYAAARVFTPRTLSSPLVLQLVSQNEVVLAEEDIQPQPGQISEWYVGYTYGEQPPDETPQTWAEVEAGGTLPDTDPDHPTWNEMEALGYWDAIDNTPQSGVGGVYARLVQREPSQDTWYVDNVSVFEDPIRWEFSNDAGATWWAAFDIRNDPNGVLVFPDHISDDPAVGRSLMWRVKGFRPGLSVSGLSIRPWYDSLRRGIPHQETLQAAGPNSTPQDHLRRIEDDPWFRAWHRPIPQSWWFLYRQWLARTSAQFTTAPVPLTRPFYLADRLVYPAGAPVVYLTPDIVVE